MEDGFEESGGKEKCVTHGLPPKLCNSVTSTRLGHVPCQGTNGAISGVLEIKPAGSDDSAPSR